MSVPSRNDPCPCGSGKKYKKCCLAAASSGEGNATNSLPRHERLLQAVALHQAGKLDEAKTAYQSLLKENPNDSDALHYLGLIAFQQGRNSDSAHLIEQAIKRDGTNPAFHFNLGNAYKQLHQLDSAANAYCTAIRLDPQFFKAHFNLANTFKNQGKIDAAAENYRNALAINPDHAEAHFNLGLVLQETGLENAAAASYRQALLCKPDFADVYFALHALLLNPLDMASSIESMQRAVDLAPDNANFRYFLGVLLDYSGNTSAATNHFKIIEKCEGLYRARLDAWRYIKSASGCLPKITGYPAQAFKLGLDAAHVEGLVLEFGVRFGTSIRQIAALAKQEVHGFDSFEGLPDGWYDEPKGSYSTNRVIPVVPDSVTLHAGWFEDTLPRFLSKFGGPVRFMNVDCDIYSSTRTILELLAERILPGTVIVFDEYIGNEHWREDEFKAFQEAIVKFGWNYEYLCFSCVTKQVAVRITD